MMRMDGATKAAIVLLAADRTRAIELLKRLDADEVRSIAQGAERLESLDAGLISGVISSFEETFHQGMKFLGTAEEVRELIVEAIGEDTIAAALAGAPQPLAHAEPWPAMRALPVEEVRAYVVAQHPQVAAFILSRIDRERVAEILQDVDPGLCADLMTRMLSLGEPPGPVVRAIEEAVARELLKPQSGGAGQIHADLAAVLNRLDEARATVVITTLQESRPADAKLVERLLFRFEDLIKLPPGTLTTIVEAIPVEQLVIALAGAAPDFQAAVLGVMSARARRMAESELQSGAGVNMKAVTSARQFVCDAVLRLQAAGTIDLGGERA